MLFNDPCTRRRYDILRGGYRQKVNCRFRLNWDVIELATLSMVDLITKSIFVFISLG